MGKIQDELKKFMEDPHAKFCSVGSFTVTDFNNLNKVLNNTEEDFLIFDNGGGRKFDIYFDRTAVNEKNQEENYFVKNFITHLLKDHPSWIFSYQINKEQVVRKKIIY